MNSKLCFLLVSSLVFLADQMSKLWAERVLSQKTVEIIPGFLQLKLAYNEGAAFSIFSQAPELLKIIFLLALPLLIAAAVVYYAMFKAGGKRSCLGLAFIFGGALGNLYDRILKGSVVDFIDFYFNGYHYPTFNLADSMIFIGILMVLFDKRGGSGQLPPTKVGGL